jgi:hypothetical protein
VPGAGGAAAGGMAAVSGATGGAAGGLSLELVDIVGAAGGVALAPGAGVGAAGGTALAPGLGLVPGARDGAARMQAPKCRRQSSAVTYVLGSRVTVAGGGTFVLGTIVGAAGGVALAPGAGVAAVGATAPAPCVGLVPGARAGTARLQAPKCRRLLACAPMLCGEGLGAPHSRQDAFLANCKSRQPGQNQSPGCGVSLLPLLYGARDPVAGGVAFALSALDVAASGIAPRASSVVAAVGTAPLRLLPRLGRPPGLVAVGVATAAAAGQRATLTWPSPSS